MELGFWSTVVVSVVAGAICAELLGVGRTRGEPPVTERWDRVTALVGYAVLVAPFALLLWQTLQG